MTSPATYDTEYVAFEEIKVPSKNAGERFFLKFYLLSAQGEKVLAATAEDQGDAHYIYKNSRGFNQYGILDSHSRRDVIMWLEKIIHESGSQFAKTAAGREPLMLKTDEHPDGIYFVKEDQKYSTFSDGRRCTEWYLVDNHGKAHCAVIGEENHARDGHYVYRSVEPFSSESPLECRNKAGVYKWLETWMVHEEGLLREKRERQRKARPKRRPVVLDVGSPSNSTRKYASNNKDMVPFRPSLIRKKASPTTHPDVVKAQESAREKEKLLLDALNFCYSKASDLELESMQHWIRIIQELKHQWDQDKSFSHDTQELVEDEKVIHEETGFVYLKRNFYGLCMEAFREIGTMFVSLDLMHQTKIAQIIAPFRYYPDHDIAHYVRHVCDKWTREIQKHKNTLTSSEMLKDPLDAVEHLLKIDYCDRGTLFLVLDLRQEMHVLTAHESAKNTYIVKK